MWSNWACVTGAWTSGCNSSPPTHEKPGVNISRAGRFRLKDNLPSSRIEIREQPLRRQVHESDIDVRPRHGLVAAFVQGPNDQPEFFADAPQKLGAQVVAPPGLVDDRCANLVAGRDRWPEHFGVKRFMRGGVAAEKFHGPRGQHAQSKMRPQRLCSPLKPRRKSPPRAFCGSGATATHAASAFSLCLSKCAA